MKITDVKINDIKKCRNLEEEIRLNVIGKYNYGDISLKEIAEFINENDEYKLQIFYPDSLDKGTLIPYLKEKTHIEIINRIKTGEIEIIKKALSPYMTFISSLRNTDRILEILETIITNLEIQDEDNILIEAFDKIEIIKKIIEAVCKENKEKILANDFSFVKNNITMKFIKIFIAKKQNKNIVNAFPTNELDTKIESNIKAKKIKQYLIDNNIMLRHIYIILLRYDLFDYERESIEHLSSFFGVSKERIALDQNKAILQLFHNNLIDNFCKLCPHPKETHRYLNEIYKNGYNEETKLALKEPKLSIYTQNLCVLTNTTKEEVTKLIAKLNLEDQNFIKNKYDENYELINKKDFNKTNTMAIVNKLKRLSKDKTYKPISNKNSNLSLKLNIEKERLTEIIKKFTLLDQDFIYSTFDTDFNNIRPLKLPKERVRLNKLIKDIKEIINNTEYDPKHFKNLYKRIKISKEELETIFAKLSEDDRKILLNWYDENWDEKIENQIGNDQRKISQIVAKIKALLKPKKARNKKIIYLYNYYKITKDELDKIILKLYSDDQDFLHLYYDENYVFKKDLPEDDLEQTLAKNRLKKIKITIGKLIRDPEYLNKKNLKKSKESSKGKTLYELLEIPLEKLPDLITKLSAKDIAFLNENYDKDFYRTKRNDLTPEEVHKLNLKLNLVRNKIRQLYNNPNYKIRNGIKKEKVKVYSKGMTLYKLLGIAIIELESIIPKLSEKDQQLLADNYDKDYYRVKHPELTREESVKLCGRLYVIRNKILKLHENPDYNIRNGIKKEKTKVYSKGKTLYELVNLSLDNIELIIPKLNETDKQLISENYDLEYYRIKRPDLSKDDMAKLNGRLYVIRKKILKLHENPNYYEKTSTTKIKEYVTLYGLLNISKEELELLIPKLSTDEQTLLKGAYDADYRIIRTKVTNEKEAQARRGKLSYIRKKLRNMINPKKDNRKKSLDTVLDISKSKLKKIIKKLSISEQEFIKSQYTDDFEPMPNDNLSETEITKNRNKMAGIRNKIRKYIDNPNYIPGKPSKSLCKRLETDFITTNKLIALLEEDEKEKVLNTYDELDNYSKKSTASVEDSKYINAKIIPKLKRYLTNGLQVKRIKHKKGTSLDNVLDFNITKQSIDNSLNILELIIMTSIASGERYSTNSIAKFLGMEESVVVDMIKNYLLNCQEKYNRAMEEHIKLLDTPLALERKLPNKKEEN